MSIVTRSNVNIDIVFPTVLLTLPKRITRKLPGLIRRITVEGKNFWKSEAGRKLKSSRTRYQAAIDFDISSSTSATLSLTDSFALDIEFGSPGFDMKPGFMRGAKPFHGKKKFPASIRALLKAKSPISMYRIIPINVGRYINTTKPKMFRMVHDQSGTAQTGPNAGKTAWQHPGIKKPANIIDTVMDELATNIIPKQVDQFIKDNF